MSQKKQFNFKIDAALLARLDTFVDGVRFRTRGHLAEVAILEFLDHHKQPTQLNLKPKPR